MNSRIEIESLKERISLTRVVGHYRTLEKQGAVYMGLCPFHDDHHPSLRVDPAKGLFHCFSCQAGGDVFRFVEKIEGCNFGEAMKICADICRLPLPERPLKGEAPASRKPERPSKKLPLPTLEENEQFLRTLLPYDPGMEELRAVYTAFGVGLAPARVPEMYNFTAHRLVFPIRNAQGQLVAFSARYLGTKQDKKIPKYLNSATSPLYKKDTLLYAWERAAGEIRRTGLLYLTEGYKDTLAMHSAGFTNTVALCGVNLSAAHIETIRREAQTVCLFLDADEVGRDTVAKIRPLLRQAGLQIVDLLPEGGKDPDELFRRMGRETFTAWVRCASLPPLRRRLESLLVAACRRWPDTRCLLADGTEQLYSENIIEVLTYEDMLPGYEPVPASDADLDSQYVLHTHAAHSEEVRHSELIHYLFLCYQELRFADRIRQDTRQLALMPEAAALQRPEMLMALQHDREYLERVTRELL